MGTRRGEAKGPRCGKIEEQLIRGRSGGGIVVGDGGGNSTSRLVTTGNTANLSEHRKSGRRQRRAPQGPCGRSSRDWACSVDKIDRPTATDQRGPKPMMGDRQCARGQRDPQCIGRRGSLQRTGNWRVGGMLAGPDSTAQQWALAVRRRSRAARRHCRNSTKRDRDGNERVG